MIDTQYYQSRLEAELEAADLAEDPAIAQIHRHMAGRYHDLLIDGSGAAEPASRPPETWNHDWLTAGLTPG